MTVPWASFPWVMYSSPLSRSLNQQSRQRDACRRISLTRLFFRSREVPEYESNELVEVRHYGLGSPCHSKKHFLRDFSFLPLAIGNFCGKLCRTIGARVVRNVESVSLGGR
jgi:hypothetical protein